MVATLKQCRSEDKTSANCWRQLPPRMRILYITTPQWTGTRLTETLSGYASVHIELEEALGTAAGLARLRDQVFDAVLIGHMPGELDALEFVKGYRTGGAEEPILVLGTQTEQEMAGLCYEAGADGYLCIHTTTTRNLIWILARAIQRHHLLCENHRLNLSQQSRLQRERDEADRLLKEQQALIDDLQALRAGPSETAPQPVLPDELCVHYRELLRTYIIMGSGNLGDELKRLADLLVGAAFTPRQTLQLHLKVLEELLRGLGARSARHVMTRADLLVLEIMFHLADGYQRRYQQSLHPPRQLTLPGV